MLGELNLTSFLPTPLEENIVERLEGFLNNNDILKLYLQFFSEEELKVLVDLKLLPIVEILEIMRENPQRNFSELIKNSRELIRTGHFDPFSKLHLALEYSRYMLTGNVPMSMGEFKSLPFTRNKDDVFISSNFRNHIKAAALEAAVVFSYIEAHIDKHSPTLVIGNARYGANFVTEPLRPFLSRLPLVTVCTEYVSSLVVNGNGNHIAQLSASTIALARNAKNIFVIDGTKNGIRQLRESTHASEKSSKICRFPDAFGGYWNFFHQGKSIRYNTSFWAPTLTDSVVLGKNIYPREKHVEGTCSLHFISSSEKAFFDDAEKIALKWVTVLTPYGFKFRAVAPSETAFVLKIQEELRGELTALLKDL